MRKKKYKIYGQDASLVVNVIGFVVSLLLDSHTLSRSPMRSNHQLHSGRLYIVDVLRQWLNTVTSTMSCFTSDRERRLWIWTLTVLAAIYATLGPARTLADALREHCVLEVTIIAVVLLVAGSIIVSWAKKRPGWREIGVGLGVALAFLMVGVRINSCEERTHLIEYGILAALIHQALLERVRNGRSVWSPAALTVILTALLGSLDEVIQVFLPNRVFDARDIFFNALAGFMVVAARLAISPQRQPGWRVWFLWLMAGSIGWGWGVYWGWYDGTDPKTLQSIPAVMLAGYLGLVVGGTLIGVLQWLALRKHVKRAFRWLLANLGAVIVVGIVIFGVGMFDVERGWIVGVSLFGTVAGLFQWMVLRGQVSQAGWWVLASTVGWGLGMPAGDIVGPPGLGAVYGVITGATLVWLLRKKATGAHEPR